MYDVSADKISADVDRWITGRNAERDRMILKRRLIDGKDAYAVWEVMDELLSVLQATNPRLFDGVMRKIEEI